MFPKETDREFAQELGLKFLKYSCAKEHMDREMNQFIFKSIDFKINN